MVIIGQMLIDYFSVFSPVSTLKVEFIFLCFVLLSQLAPKKYMSPSKTYYREYLTFTLIICNW